MINFEAWGLPRSVNSTFLKQVAAETAKATGIKLKKTASVGLKVITENEIKLLNKKYAGVNSSTDVLSFSYLSEAGNSIGDIVICGSIAKKEARKKNWSLDFEYAFLTNHALLHILGYDHHVKEEKQKMYGLAKNTLAKFNIIWENE